MELIVPKDQANFLFYLSWLGLVTGLVGVFNHTPALGAAVCVGSILAMNYWRHPTYGVRRTIDIAWVQFLIWTHAYYVWNSPTRIVYFTIQAKGVAFYVMGWYYHKRGKLWKSTICHGAVHLCADISLLIYYLSYQPTDTSITNVY